MIDKYSWILYNVYGLSSEEYTKLNIETLMLKPEFYNRYEIGEVKMRQLMAYNKFVWSMVHIHGLTAEDLLKVWHENGMILEHFSARDGI